jgi:hypothetical protein
VATLQKRFKAKKLIKQGRRILKGFAYIADDNSENQQMRLFLDLSWTKENDQVVGLNE